MLFKDFFDTHNIEHLKAYKYLTDNGVWPDGFIPADCETPDIFSVITYVNNVMAMDWLTASLDGTSTIQTRNVKHEK